MRKSAKTFQDLIVWQKAHQVVIEAYRLSSHFPKYELFGLTSQFRRSAISIAANIAEGFKKKGHADKARYLNIAQGSLEEVRYYLLLIQELDYGETGKIMSHLEEVSKLLEAYTRAVLNGGYRTLYSGS